MAIEHLAQALNQTSRRRGLLATGEPISAGDRLLPGEVGVVLVASGLVLCDPALIAWDDHLPCPCCAAK